MFRGFSPWNDGFLKAKMFNLTMLMSSLISKYFVLIKGV